MFKNLFSLPLGTEEIILFSVVGLVLLVAVLVLVISTIKVRNKKQENVVETKNEEKAETENIETKEENKKEAKPEAKKEVKAEKPAPKKTAPAKVKETKTDEAVNYVVIQNNDTKSPYYKKWRVRKSNSNKTIKHFETQQLAIDLATELANKVGAKVVVHKVDGTIRD